MRTSFVSSIVLAGCLFGFALCQTGCGGEASSSDTSTKDNAIIYFSPLQPKRSFVETVPSPAPPVDADEKAGYEEIVRGFRKNAERLFKRSDIDRRIAQIERVFMSTGRYLELVGIYQRVVEAKGPTSRAAPRLAWAYIRLGQRQQAKQFIETLEEARPDDAIVHFLEGAFWFQQASESREAMARTAVAWRRALELDSDFEGFGGLNAEAVRKQLGRITSRLPRDPKAMLDASSETDTGSGEGTGPTRDEPTPPDSKGTAAATGDQTTEDDGDSAPPTGSDGSPRASKGKSDSTGTASGKEKASSKGPDAGSTATDSPDAGSASTDTSETEESDDSRNVTSIRLTEANLALEQGDVTMASKTYELILDNHPNHLGAQFGQLRVDAETETPPASIAKDLQKLLDHPDLDARTAYQMGLFARSTLDDDALAERFWKKVRSLDPEFAERMGIE